MTKLLAPQRLGMATNSRSPTSPRQATRVIKATAWPKRRPTLSGVTLSLSAAMVAVACLNSIFMLSCPLLRGRGASLLPQPPLFLERLRLGLRLIGPLYLHRKEGEGNHGGEALGAVGRGGRQRHLEAQ